MRHGHLFPETERRVLPLHYLRLSDHSFALVFIGKVPILLMFGAVRNMDCIGCLFTEKLRYTSDFREDVPVLSSRMEFPSSFPADIDNKVAPVDLGVEWGTRNVTHPITCKADRGGGNLVIQCPM